MPESKPSGKPENAPDLTSDRRIGQDKAPPIISRAQRRAKEQEAKKQKEKRSAAVNRLSQKEYLNILVNQNNQIFNALNSLARGFNELVRLTTASVDMQFESLEPDIRELFIAKPEDKDDAKVKSVPKPISDEPVPTDEELDALAEQIKKQEKS